MFPWKKKWKLDSRKRDILHSLDRTQLIHTSILLSFQFSVSLFIIPCAVFKAISKSSKLQAIPREVTPHLQPIRVLFNGAIHLWVCNSVNITCKAIVFQAVLNISVTQNPLSTRTSPKGAQKIVTLSSCGLRKFLSFPNWRPKNRILPSKFTSTPQNS